MPDKIVAQHTGFVERWREVRADEFAQEVVLVQPLTGGQSIPTRDGAPNAADIRSGQGAAGATILTVPAGRTWIGTATLEVSHAAAMGAAAATVTGSIDISGAGSTPAPGKLVEIALAIPATTATAAIGAADTLSVTIPDVVIVAPSANSVVLTVVAGGATVVRGVVVGALVAQ